MTRRLLGVVLTAGLLAALGAAPAQAAAPERDGGFDKVTFFEVMCGIESYTTLTQRWTVTDFADGSEMVHVTRTYTPSDPRLPIEKGAATLFVGPDGTETIVGKPIQLFDPDGGIRLLDAGLVSFGNELLVRGPHPSLLVEDLSPYYCG